MAKKNLGTFKINNLGNETFREFEVAILKTFEYFGFTFAVHHYVNIKEGSINTEMYTVSEITSGTAVAKYKKTRKEAVEAAIKTLDHFGEKTTKEAVERSISGVQKARKKAAK